MNMNRFVALGLSTLAIALIFTQSLWRAPATVRSPESLLDPTISSTEGRNMMVDSKQIGVPGEMLKGFLVAYEAFVRDPEIPKQKKQLENYDVGLSQEAESYVIFFVPRRKSDEPIRPGGSTELGKAVRFTINKKDYRVTQKLFYR